MSKGDCSFWHKLSMAVTNAFVYPHITHVPVCARAVCLLVFSARFGAAAPYSLCINAASELLHVVREPDMASWRLISLPPWALLIDKRLLSQACEHLEVTTWRVTLLNCLTGFSSQAAKA